MTTKPNLDDFSKEEIVEVLSEIRHPVDVAIYGAGNYFNIAGIIRTAHSFLVRKIYLVDIEESKDPFYEKGTMGNHKYEDIELLTLKDFLEKTSERNIVSFERRPGLLTTKTSWGYEYPNEPILVFGSEKSGVPDEILNVSKDVVSIPMFGINNDLNISVAFGMAIYDWTIKHHSKRKTVW